MEKHVVSMELSRELYKAGYPQKPIGKFYWIISRTTPYHVSFVDGDKDLLPKHRNDYYVAPLADEILEQSPAMLEIEGRKSYLVIEKFPYSNHFEVSYINELTKSVVCMLKGKVLANVLAEMWLYLKENNLLEVKG